MNLDHETEVTNADPTLEPTRFTRYRCIKEVDAFKISRVETCSNKGIHHAYLHYEGLGAKYEVSAAYMKKHVPARGGYFVRYADGYESYSPSVPFESGYVKIHAEDAKPAGTETA